MATIKTYIQITCNHVSGQWTNYSKIRLYVLQWLQGKETLVILCDNAEPAQSAQVPCEVNGTCSAWWILHSLYLQRNNDQNNQRSFLTTCSDIFLFSFAPIYDREAVFRIITL